jgi:hypothetical protein
MHGGGRGGAEWRLDFGGVWVQRNSPTAMPGVEAAGCRARLGIRGGSFPQENSEDVPPLTPTRFGTVRSGNTGPLQYLNRERIEFSAKRMDTI